MRTLVILEEKHGEFQNFIILKLLFFYLCLRIQKNIRVKELQNSENLELCFFYSSITKFVFQKFQIQK